MSSQVLILFCLCIVVVRAVHLDKRPELEYFQNLHQVTGYLCVLL